jgi:ABC-2 type transport system permease protein
MRKLLGAINKEMIMMLRDIPGLILLFLLPLFLVIVVTLTQEKALSKIDNTMISVIVVDDDANTLGNSIINGLKESKYFEIITEYRGKKLDKETATGLIHKGEYHVGIIIPRGATDSAQLNAHNLIQKSFVIDSTATDSLLNSIARTKITIYYDPAINESYRTSVVSSIRMLIQAAEIKIMLENFLSVLRTELKVQYKTQVKQEVGYQMQIAQKQFMSEVKKKMGNFPMDKMKPPNDSQAHLSSDLKLAVSDKNFPWKAENILKVNEEFAKKAETIIKPSIIQNNVPGFSLFAMFFIVIPLSGSIILERNEGAFHRVRTLPVSYLTILSGKIFLFMIVCLLQFLLLLFMGMKFFPLIDLPGLTLGANYGGIIVAALASSLAAVGFGLIIGTVARTYAQAAMFGSTMVVILAIMGGVFIPVYLMPETMKVISNISPIRWGIDSFLTIFVREGNIASIGMDVIKLVSFFIVALLISLFSFVRRK